MHNRYRTERRSSGRALTPGSQAGMVMSGIAGATASGLVGWGIGLVSGMVVGLTAGIFLGRTIRQPLHRRPLYARSRSIFRGLRGLWRS